MDEANKQIERMKQAGYSNAITNSFERSMEATVNKALTMEIQPENTPFLPVVPRVWLGIGEQAKKLQNDGQRASIYLEYSDLVNMFRVFENSPYWIYNVAIGSDALGPSLEEARRHIEGTGRRFLIVEEIIAFCLHTNVLKKDGVSAGLSYYKKEGCVPCLHLFDEIVIFTARHNDPSILGRRLASCSEQISRSL